MPIIAPHFKFEYFQRGSTYSAKSEFQRFVTLDYNLKSYVGVIGVGVISGWEIEATTDRNIQILPGRGIIDGFFSESPYEVKRRSEMVIPEREVEVVKLQEAPEPDMTTAELAAYTLVIQDYDPSFTPETPTENSYVKVSIPYSMTLPNDADSYIYVNRKHNNFFPALADYPPYLIPKPSINDYSDFADFLVAQAAYEAQMATIYTYDWRDDPANHFTEVVFSSSTTLSQTPLKVLIGRVTTRDNQVVNIDTSNINNLQKLESTIKKYANRLITNHHHGGTEEFDPIKINLETDVRQAILTSYAPESRRGIFSVLESQFSGTTDGHRHTFSVDDDGNGQTVGLIGSSENHFHKIINGVVQTQENTNGLVADHVHTIPDVSKLTWDVSSEYIVYVNGIPVGDNNSDDISANPNEKTITLTGIIGGITKTYGVSFEHEGTLFDFSQQQSGVYRFMLNATREFNIQFPNASLETNPFVFFDEETNSVAGFADLRSQSVTAEALLRDSGDTFIFTPDAARNIRVTLIDYQKTVGLEADNVALEVLGNSEIKGVIRPENIFFINAQKISTGIFEISQIPFLSHVGRIDESFSAFKYPLISKDGVEFLVVPSVTETTLGHFHNILVTDQISGLTENTFDGDEPVYYSVGNDGDIYLIAHVHPITLGEIKEVESQGLLDWQNDINGTNETSSTHTHEIIYPNSGDAKAVYSMFEDRHGNIYAGTSDNLIMIPSDDAYVFVINGIQFYETGTDLLSMFERAKINYEVQTEEPLKIESEIYTTQIAIAEAELVNVGDSYLIIGKSSGDPDETMIQKVGFIPVPNYKSSFIKDFDEVGENEIIIEVQLRDADTGGVLDPTNPDVIAQIEEDPTSVKEVAVVEKRLDKIPTVSIQVSENTRNGIIYDDILTIGANICATNRNIHDNFYTNWESPNTPSSIEVFQKVEQDEEGSIWVATDNGVLVLRSHNKSTIFSKTTRPGNTPIVSDIFVFTSDCVFCASDGIYKTEDQGKTWTLKLTGNFKQIVNDFSSVEIQSNFGHTHEINVNIHGNGTLEESDGHTHIVTDWTVEESDGHTHELKLLMYAVSQNEVYKSTNSGEDWTQIATLPTEENGEVFAFFGNVYLAKPDGIYQHSNGWSIVSQILAYSFQPSYDLSSFYVGSLNNIYQTLNGTTYEEEFLLSGFSLNILQVNETNKYFGYSYNNRAQTFFLNDITVTDQTLSSLVVFDKWFAENGSWDETAPYDIYIDNKLILSTKTNVDNREDREWSFTVEPTVGIIDFSGETILSSGLEVFDNFIEVEDSSSFQSEDKILIKQKLPEEEEDTTTSTVKTKEEIAEEKLERENIENTYLYVTISSVSNSVISFSPRSIIAIPSGSDVIKIPRLDANSSIRLNIYDSHLSNIGTNNHQELEDKLSYESDQRPYELNNSYLSNLLQLTQAVKYVYPDIDSEMTQTLFYDFHYSDDPLDENYVGNFIDIQSSEAYSLVNFRSQFEAKGALSINKILIGTGSFSNKIIVGTDLGVFWAILTENINANWFYVWDLEVPVYDMSVFGEENLLVATNDGVYLTNDMVTWTLQEQEAISFPALSMSLRWPENNFVIIPSHTATFKNIDGDPSFGKISTTGGIYSALDTNRAIKIELLSDPLNQKNNTNYIIREVFPNSIFVSPQFIGETETLSDVKITMGSWWQQFQGEDNTGNESLTNTLLVGGKNKIAYTPFLGDFVWTSGLFEEEIGEVNIVNFLPLSSGGILASAVGTNLENITHHVIRSSDLGGNWSSFKKLEEVIGTIRSSNLTAFNHTLLEVDYSFTSAVIRADGEFDKRTISIFAGNKAEPIFTGRVIFNEGFTSTLVLWGQGANEAIIQNQGEILSFRILPVSVVDMVETGDKRILFGTEIGIFEDSQTTLGEFPFVGSVGSVGFPGRITNIDVSGLIKSISVNPSNNAVILSIESDDNISTNQYKGQSLYIIDLPTTTSFTIFSNSSRTIGGEITVELEAGFSPVWLTYTGKSIKFVGAQSILDVDFDFTVTNNQFANGTLTISTDENNNSGTVYNIVSNTSNQIIINYSITPLNLASPDGTNLDATVGQSFINLDSSGRVPINVTFTQSVIDNFLTDFSFDVTNGDSQASFVNGMTIYQNSRNKIILNDFSGLIGTEDTSNPIALIIQPNDTFRCVGSIYQPLSSFNNKKTSTESAHYHELDLIGDYVDGTITSFDSILNEFVTFTVGDTTLFDSPLVQKDGSLFEGARIRFFTPAQAGIEYFSEVISFTATTITVRILDATDWNFNEYSDILISETWNWEINATNYGYTNGIYYDDFITSSSIVTEDITTGDSTVKVTDTSNMVTDDKIIIISSSNKSEVNFIKSIIDLTTIELNEVASNSYFVQNTVQVKVLRDEFSNIHEHMIRNNQVETISVSDYLNKGYPSQHSHRNIALIDVISDMENEKGNIIVAGSSSFIYNSTNNGSRWERTVDLNDFVEENIEINGIVSIESRSGQIVVGTTNGEIFSTGSSDGDILPLNQPKIS